MVTTTKERTEFALRAHPALKHCQELMDKKSHDYSGGAAQDHSRKDYHPYGDVSYLQMLHTKFRRMEMMVRLKMKGESPNFESLQDSVSDLINYAAFYWSYLEEESSDDV